MGTKRVEDENCPFRKFIKRHISKDESFSSKGSNLGPAMASTSENNGDPLMGSDEFVRDNSALLSLHPWIFKKESYHEGTSTGVNRSRRPFRSKRIQRFSIKPINFVGNYITPFAGDVEMEEYALGSPPNSPAPSFRPFVVTDGRRVISKSSFGYFGMQHENGLYKEESSNTGADGVNSRVKKSVIGVPSLPDLRKLKRKSSGFWHERTETSKPQDTGKVSESKGCHDGMRPLCTGISIGMISALLLKGNEVDNLRKLLKQTEDLVQDLQEELEMKDALSVKELAYGVYESQNLIHRHSDTEGSLELWVNQNLTTHIASNNSEENSESLRKIEAELEAELERLEQNMNSCSVEQRVSDLSELDPELMVDVVHGELRADNLATDLLSNSDTTSTAQTYNANYSVSPSELSLRLHQVIQSRLEQRIEELERELLNSKKQLQVMEAKRASSQSILSNSDSGFSPNQGSPKAMPPKDDAPLPISLNLAGDALNAYDEAYEEFMQMTGKEAKQLSPVNYKADFIDGCKSSSSCRSLPWENNLWSRGSDETIDYEEEDDGSDTFTDEEGKMLIQQLVEKTKKRFPCSDGLRNYSF